MHATRLRIDADAFTQDFLQSARRRFPAFAVELAHALDMAREMPLGHKRGDDGLGQFRTTAEKGLADVFEAFDLRWRHHQVRKADPRKQHLAERAGVEHPSITVQAFQRGQGTADVAVFAVVIVLDNPGLLPAGPLKQFQSARQ
ncbi:hypothetical protein D3C84_826850 [compost metagenome]